MSKVFACPAPSPLPPLFPEFDCAPFHNIAPVETAWLWKPYVPAAGVVVLDGEPGVGKSTLVAWLAAELSRGRLAGTGGAPQTTIFLSGQDHAGMTLRPRLEAFGADLLRVGIARSIYKQDGPWPIALDRHASHLAHQVERLQIQLVVVDPMLSFLGKINPSDSRRMTQLITKLWRLGHLHHCCFLLVRHVSKRGGRRAINRGDGCAGLIGAARVGLMLMRGSEPNERYLATIKNNLAQEGPTLRFRFNDGRPELAGIVPLSADDLLAIEAVSVRGLARDADAAARFLTELVQQPLPCAAVKVALARAGFRERAVRAGLDQAGIRHVKQGKQWLYLPPGEDVGEGEGGVGVQDETTPSESPQPPVA